MKNLILFLCLGLIGCESSTEYKVRHEMEDASYVSSLSYFKDKRTGLCFAASGLGWNYGVLTNVPCTPEVEKLIR